MTFSPQLLAHPPAIDAEPPAHQLRSPHRPAQQNAVIHLTASQGDATSHKAHGRIDAAALERKPVFQAIAKIAGWSFHITDKQLEQAGFDADQIRHIRNGTIRDVNTERAAYREGPDWRGKDGFTYCQDPARPGEVFRYDRNKVAFGTGVVVNGAAQAFDPYAYVGDTLQLAQIDSDPIVGLFLKDPQAHLASAKMRLENTFGHESPDGEVEVERERRRAEVLSAEIAATELTEQYTAIREHFKADKAQQAAAKKLAAILEDKYVKLFNDRAFEQTTARQVNDLAAWFETHYPHRQR